MIGLNEPRQRRSERTLESVLHAAEALLAEAPPESVSVAAICRRAGVTTGAFYARFQDREALFRLLEEKVCEAFDEAAERALGAAGNAGLAELLGAVFATTAELYRRHRGAIRALRMLALTDPERAARLAAYNGGLLERVVARVLDHRAAIARPHPETSAREIVVWVVTILRQRILFDELALAPSEAERTDRLVDLALAYLTCPGGSR